MSSWSQAVWVVKQLQKSFELDKQIDDFIEKINELNLQVNTSIIQKVNDLIDDIQDMPSTIIDEVETDEEGKITPKNHYTDSEKSPVDGVIWLIV